MTAYIEYVFLENFILDGLLLYGSCRFTKTPVRYARLCVSAGVGGVYALVSPFIRLPIFWGWVLKICVGAGLCLLAFGRIHNRKEWGRYAFFLTAFLLFTFVVAGFLLTVWQNLARKPSFVLVLTVLALGIAGIEIFLAVYRQKRRIHSCMYECVVFGADKRAVTQGYWDSGNMAQKDGLPVCFISPLLFFKVFGDFAGGVERLRITTVAGEREVPIVLGKILVKAGKNARLQEVYFSPSKHIVFREYEVLLPAGLASGQAHGA